MAIILVKTESTDNGYTEYFRKSTENHNVTELSSKQFSVYLKECKEYDTHIEQGELYTVTTHLLKF